MARLYARLALVAALVLLALTHGVDSRPLKSSRVLLQDGESDIPAGGESSDIPAPAGGESSDIPAGGESSGTPAGGESSSTPAGGESSGTPAGGESSGTPAGGESSGTPAGGESSGTPAGGESSGTPAGGESSGTPAGGESSGTPAGGESSGTPAGGESSAVTTSSPSPPGTPEPPFSGGSSYDNTPVEQFFPPVPVDDTPPTGSPPVVTANSPQAAINTYCKAATGAEFKSVCCTPGSFESSWCGEAFAAAFCAVDYNGNDPCA